MSKLSKLLGKPKDFNIGGEVFTIHPLSVKEDLELVLKLGEKDTQAAAFKELIIKSIKKSVPDATDEEINNLSLSFFKDFQSAVLEVNGLSAEVEWV